MKNHPTAVNFHGYGSKHAWTLEAGGPWYEGDPRPEVVRARRQALRASRVRTAEQRADAHLTHRAEQLVKFIFSDMDLDDWQQRCLINTLRAQGKR